MLLEFPDDPTTANLDGQYMLGPSLLVAPILRSDGRASCYLPAGRWTHLITGVVAEGPCWLDGRYEVLSLPLFVRPGSVLPMGARDDRADYDFAEGVTLRAYELADGASVRVEVPGLDGEAAARFEVVRRGASVEAERLSGSLPWRLLLVGCPGLESVEGGTAEKTAEGMLISAAAGSGRVAARPKSRRGGRASISTIYACQECYPRNGVLPGGRGPQEGPNRVRSGPELAAGD
jgi:alpha-D-xyloside xylohydrolase